MRILGITTESEGEGRGRGGTVEGGGALGSRGREVEGRGECVGESKRQVTYDLRAPSLGFPHITSSLFFFSFFLQRPVMSRVAALRPLARASKSPSVSIPRRLHTTRLLRASESPRYYSPPREKKGIKIGYLFSGLALLGPPSLFPASPDIALTPPSPAAGITATSLGLYRFYSTYTAYPNTTSHPIRTLLRRALTASNAGDPARASAAFAQAYALALDLASRGELGSSEESLMRTSGIVIRCGAMWEAVGQLAKARENYELAWGECKDRIERGGAGEKEVMRAVGVALKVGDLWVEEGAVGDKEAEAYFVWAVETMMRLGMNAAQKEKVREEVVHGVVPAKGEEKTKEGREDGWDLPEWLGKVELVAGFERLGDLYARIGKPESVPGLFPLSSLRLLVCDHPSLPDTPNPSCSKRSPPSSLHLRKKAPPPPHLP